jgi:hypothetical protein
MKKANRIMILFTICAMPFGGNAQKLWDGEANDGKWNSDSNWYPNGVPLATDDVILNNNFMSIPYTVTMPNGSGSIQISSLTIQSNALNPISLNIPDVNTASPAISLNNLNIGNGGILINNSGATAGNTFLINGNMKIENGGKYIHRTIRGNAYLISKLMYSANNKNGTMEFDVPGTAGYTLSLSGRSFGTLILSANKAGGKKTYSGSGNGNLTIYGNIETGTGTVLTSSLNGNLLIAGNLTNYGTISLNPSTQDTLGRELIFNGDSSKFFSNGVFQQNSAFRKIKIDKNSALQLNAPITISTSNTLFEVSTNAFFYPDTFYIQGGQFLADSLSTLGISSAAGISQLPNTGNIRSTSFNFHPSVCMLFEKAGDQTNGNAFPQKIATLIMKKPSGNLILNKGFHVSDSMDLTLGKIISSNENMISLSGKIINNKTNHYGWFAGNNQSFVDGPMKIITDTARNIVFPIGKVDVFAPVMIYKNTADSATYILEYFKEKSPKIDSVKQYPLKNINEYEYWSFQKTATNASVETKEILSISRRENSLTGLIEQPTIANFSDTENKWNAVSLATNGLKQQYLMGVSTPIKNGCFTFGRLEALALPFEKFIVSYSLQNTLSKIKWTNAKDPETEYYRLEKSEDGKKFIQLANITASKKSPQSIYQYECIYNEIEESFLRVLAFDKSDHPIFSNTIFIKKKIKNQPLYPNPATDKIFFTTHDAGSVKNLSIISWDGKILKPTFSKERNGYSINISMLPAGAFTLLCQSGETTESHTFIKN